MDARNLTSSFITSIRTSIRILYLNRFIFVLLVILSSESLLFLDSCPQMLNSNLDLITFLDKDWVLKIDFWQIIRIPWLSFEFYLLCWGKLDLCPSSIYPIFKCSVFTVHMTVTIESNKKYVFLDYEIDGRVISNIPWLLVKLSAKSFINSDIIFIRLMIFVFRLDSNHVLNNWFFKINLNLEIWWASGKLLLDFVLFLDNFTNHHAKLKK